MSLAQIYADDFTLTQRTQGRRIYNTGGVVIHAYTRERVQASVADRTQLKQKQEVSVAWVRNDEGTILTDCTCQSEYSDQFCRHIWATLLAMDSNRMGPTHRIPGTYEEAVWTSERGRIDSVGGGGLISTSPNGGGSPTHGGPMKGSSATGDWRRVLDGVAAGHVIELEERPFWGATQGRRRPCFVLDVRQTFQAGDPMIHLYQQERRRNGDFGKIKPLTQSAIQEDSFESPAEHQLVRFLNSTVEARDEFEFRPRRSYGRGPDNLVARLDPTIYDVVLPKLAATQRLYWLLDSTLPVEEARQLHWDDGPAWRFRPLIRSHNKRREWQVSGSLYRGDEVVPLDSVVIVLRKGLVMLPDRLARCEVTESFPWVCLLRERSSITISYDERVDFVERLFHLSPDDRGKLPKTLRWPEVPLPPQGCLQVHQPEGRHRQSELRASVTFRYGDRKITAASRQRAMVDTEQRRILTRDLVAEQRLCDELAQAGLKPSLDYRQPAGKVEFPANCLPDVVYGLVRAGWEVEAEGRLVRSAGQCRLSVKSSVDWFQLDGEFDFDGVSADLPELLKAIRQGDRYVKLSDGSHGLLPEDWLTRYAGLAELGTAREGAIGFRPSQAALLDALLQAQADQTQLEIDQEFTELCGRLRSFDGIQTCPPPERFEGELRDYQQLGLSWLQFLREFRLGGCLADDMGLGKTIQVLAMLQHCRETAGPQATQRLPSLVVAPRSLMFNWMEEAARFTPDLKVVNYTGLDRQQVWDEISEADLVLTTYGTLRRDIVKLQEQRFEYAILDEAQAIKNASSQSSKACRLLVANHRLAMTGTPVENHLGELWSLFEFLNPGLLGSSAAFQRLFQSSSPADTGSLEVLGRALAPFILRRTKQEVLRELPEKTEQTLHCQMSPQQRQQYDQLRDYYREQLSRQIEQKGIKRAKIHVLEALLRLRQAACHPGLLDKDQADRPSAKLDTLLDQLERVIDEGHKALVFSQFTRLLGIVRQRLDRQNVPYAYLDGRTKDREEQVKRFQQDPQCPLFLISLKAGGFGLNLTAAEYVFILDPWWNPAVEAQAVDRVHRIGQTQPVFAYRLICEDTVEERILELQQSKRELAEAIVSTNSNVISQLTSEDLQMLLS